MSAILNLVILDLAILVFPLKITHTCQDWFPPFAHKKLQLFILTQLDDGSHLEICHLGFSHFEHLVKIHSKNFTHSFSNSFNLMMMAAILNTAILDSAILHKPLSQTNSFWLNLMMSDILNSAILDSAILNKKKTSLIHSDSTWWCQTSWILPSWIQPFWTSKKTSLIHSHSTWWCQTSWILPSWIQPFWTKKNFTHSFWLNLMMAAILNSAMLEFSHCHLGFRHLVIFISDSLKNTLSPLWLWLKLIQWTKKNSNSFILT